MDSPMCLIENRNGQELVINQEAERILSGITQPVVVVAIVGKYRTGKSYLMNKLARSQTGFPLGSTIQSKTKGIWMWCVPHPCKPGHTLVLLDTEGLGDVEKGDSKNDAWIFCLAVLLSSNFVFNSLGTIDQQAMEQIHYVAELTKRIKFKSNKEEDEDDSGKFKGIFPTFTWCVRDFSLDLEMDGKEVTEDEYLMNSLKLKQGIDEKINDYNLPREYILHYFHSHKCFVFERPASSKKLRKLEQLEESELEEDFVEQTKKFCNYMFKHGNVKTLPGGMIVTGKMLGNLTTTYINTIQSGSVPCMENAVLALSMIENTGAVQDALAKYGADMNQQAQRFPTETLEEFLHIHRECEKEAIKVFLGRSFNDKDQKYQKELKNLLDQRMKTFSERNENASLGLCQSLIQSFSSTLMSRISLGYYCKAGGHNMFLAEKLNVIASYNNWPKKGLKSFEVLQNFRRNIKATEDSIERTDATMTMQAKEIAERKKQAERAERERQILEQNKRHQQEMMERQRKIQEQHEKMLKDKIEQDILRMKQEHQRVVQQQLEEQRARQNAEFQAQCNILQEQINRYSGNSGSSGGDCVLL